MAKTLRVREHLRKATAADHRSVDSLFSRFDLGSEGGYGDFLLAQAEALLPLEAALDRADAAEVLDDWPDRRRGDLLRADLEMLGLRAGTSRAAPPIAEPAAMLGAIYVLEGSRLGGRVLVRSVPETMPRAFLSASGHGLWHSLLAQLEQKLRRHVDLHSAIDAARAVFALFETGARRHLRDRRLAEAR